MTPRLILTPPINGHDFLALLRAVPGPRSALYPCGHLCGHTAQSPCWTCLRQSHLRNWLCGVCQARKTGRA